MVVKHDVKLGMKPGSSARATSALNHWATLPAPPKLLTQRLLPSLCFFIYNMKELASHLCRSLTSQGLGVEYLSPLNKPSYLGGPALRFSPGYLVFWLLLLLLFPSFCCLLLFYYFSYLFILVELEPESCVHRADTCFSTELHPQLLLSCLRQSYYAVQIGLELIL